MRVSKRKYKNYVGDVENMTEGHKEIRCKQTCKCNFCGGDTHMSKCCLKHKLKEAGKVYALQYEEPSSSDHDSDNEDGAAQMVRTDAWEDSDEEEESDREEQEERVYNINQSSGEGSEEDSEDEEMDNHIAMVRFEPRYSYETEEETDMDSDDESTEGPEESEEEYEVEDWESEDEEDNIEGPTLEERENVTTESEDEENVNMFDVNIKLYRQEKDIFISDEESDTAETFMSDEEDHTHENIERTQGK